MSNKNLSQATQSDFSPRSRYCISNVENHCRSARARRSCVRERRGPKSAIGAHSALEREEREAHAGADGERKEILVKDRAEIRGRLAGPGRFSTYHCPGACS